MKSFLFFLIISIITFHFSFAQTNTFPSNGNVGIGTTAPEEKLVVTGNQKLFGNLSFGSDQTAYFIKGSGNGGAIRLRTNIGNAVDRDIQFGNIDNAGTWNSYMAVGQTGDVGIGTTSPIGKFEVYDGNRTGVIAYFGANGISGAKGLYFRRPVLNTNPINIQGTISGVGAADISLQFEGGNVGIGTSTPMSKLEIVSHLDNNQLTLSKNTIIGQEGPGVVFKNKINDGSIPEIGGVQAKLLSGAVGAVASSLSLYTKYNSSKVEAVTISPVGNVGIGITYPSEKLSVNGNIRAREIKVTTTDWPDYVFDEAFKVLPLSELESFIKTNKHLPEIPSALEAERNGIELGEMNKKLLKKIEELTLYLLEANKKIAILEKSNQKIDELDRKLIELINMNNLKSKLIFHSIF